MCRLLTLFLLLPFLARGQTDTIPESIPPRVQDLLEDFLQNTESEGTFDFNTLFEQLALYQEYPLNLNEAGEGQLQEFGLLTDLQIVELLNYRREAGPLISLYELQAIPGFDLPAIRRILPFVTVESGLDDFQISIPTMLARGKNEFFLRWSQIVEEQRGFTPLGPEERGARYLGDPSKVYLRYRHSYSNKLSYGFTAEKDAGEEFFTGSNPNGFDYYSFHLYLSNYNRRIKAIALGDYTISFGQGLVLYSGFGYGKGSNTTSIKRGGRAVYRYTSVNESSFLRGGAATINLTDQLELTGFVSSRGRDGNLLEPDTSQVDGDLRSLSRLDIDGLHRTPNEIEDQNVVNQFTTGGSLQWNHSFGHVAVNALHDRFDKPINRSLEPYNRFFFRGDRQTNVSLDYSFIYENFNFFGETAQDGQGHIASINGLLIGLDRKVDLALFYRHLPAQYVSLNANPLAETTGGRNEQGLYIGAEIRPAKRWTLNLYYDAWRHPWLRFRVDAPSRGHEYRARLTYEQRRKLRIYLEARGETKAINAPDNETNFNFTTPRQLFQTRLHIAPQLSKALELRTRFDFGFADNEVEGRRYGFSVLQDILYRPIEFPLSFTTRFAIFETDDYDIRFYHYENGLLYAFAIPAYYNRGTRFYLNLRYRPIKALTLEFRVAQTYWSNQETIGSGLDEIDGPVRTELGAQIKYQFR